MTGGLAVLFVILAAANPAALAGTRPAGKRRASPGRAGTGQAGTGQAGTGQAGTGQAGTGQAGTGQAGTGQAGTGQAGTGQARAASAFDHPRLRGVALGLGVVAVIALGTEAILDALSVSAPTFRTAAGAVIGIGGAVEVLRRHSPRPTAADADPVDDDSSEDGADDGGGDGSDKDLVSGLLATLMPPLVFAAVAMSADDAWWLTAVALVMALAATVGLTSAPLRVRIWARIAFGGLAVGMGILLVSAGIRAV